MKFPQPSMRVHDSYPHQCEAYQRAFGRDFYLLGMYMGTGKTKVAIDLCQNWGSEKILVMCPKAVMATWRHEFGEHGVGEWPVTILDQSPLHRRCAELLATYVRGGRQVLVVNYDVVWRPAMSKVLLQKKWDCVICDESHKIKAAGAKASRLAYRLTAKKRLALTGTPMPHSPLDLYGQFRFLSPSVYGISFANFRARYAITHAKFPSKVLSWVNQDELESKLGEHSYICHVDDVMDLPEGQRINVPVVMPARGRKLYDKLTNELCGEIDAGLITPANALVKLVRLMQVTSGTVIDDDGNVRPVHDAKKEALESIIDGLPESENIVVFCLYRHELEAVRSLAEKLKRPYGEVSGNANDLDGHRLPEKVDGIGHVFGVQIKSGGAGVDLSRSHIAVYWSVGFSLGDYEQSLARLRRKGQEHAVQYYHLMVQDSMDQVVFRALQARKDTVQAVLDEAAKHGSLT